MPVNHEIFEDINDSQWLWYFYNMMEDEKEKFDYERDMVEYLASFTNPEAVGKIKNQRDNAISLTDDQFNESLKRIFGTSAEGPPQSEERKMHVVSQNPKAAMKEYRKLSKRDE